MIKPITQLASDDENRINPEDIFKAFERAIVQMTMTFVMIIASEEEIRNAITVESKDTCDKLPK